MSRIRFVTASNNDFDGFPLNFSVASTSFSYEISVFNSSVTNASRFFVSLLSNLTTCNDWLTTCDDLLTTSNGCLTTFVNCLTTEELGFDSMPAATVMFIG
jgi:hypothetical protein